MDSGIPADSPNLVLLFFLAQLFLRELYKSKNLVRIVPMDMTGYFGNYRLAHRRDFRALSPFPRQNHAPRPQKYNVASALPIQSRISCRRKAPALMPEQSLYTPCFLARKGMWRPSILLPALTVSQEEKLHSAVTSKALPYQQPAICPRRVIIAL
jgi:hypothetical protein